MNAGLLVEKVFIAFVFTGCLLPSIGAQTLNGLQFLNGNLPMADSHNCYPYDGRWGDRIDRALRSGFPIGIEQDIAWYVDPKTGEGRAVVSHSEKTSSGDPALRRLFLRTGAAHHGASTG